MSSKGSQTPIGTDDAGRPIFGRNAKGTAVCYSPKPGKPGEFCMTTARMQNGRCRVHGGATPFGAASATWVDGRKSKYHPPKRLMQAYTSALANPDLVSLREEIALLEMRIDEVFASLDEEGSAALWANVMRVWGNLQGAIAVRDAKSQGRFITELDGLILRGSEDRDKWAEITFLSEAKRRLVHEERDYLMKSDMMISQEQIWALQMTQLELMRTVLLQHVPNDTALTVLRALASQLRGQLVRADGGGA